MKKILLVEDEGHLLKSLKDKLIDKGYDVLSASNYEDAFRLGCDSKDKLHLGIIDLNIPESKGLSAGKEYMGIDLIRDLQDEECEFPCIVYTGYGDDLDRRVQAIDYGACSVIEKQGDRDHKELLASAITLIERQNIRPVRRGPLELIEDTETVLVSGQVAKLSRTEYAVFSYLFERRYAVPKDELIEHVYGDDRDDDKYENHANSIEGYISSIRKEIKKILRDSHDTDPIVNNYNGYQFAWGINH